MPPSRLVNKQVSAKPSFQRPTTSPDRPSTTGGYYAHTRPKSGLTSYQPGKIRAVASSRTFAPRPSSPNQEEQNEGGSYRPATAPLSPLHASLSEMPSFELEDQSVVSAMTSTTLRKQQKQKRVRSANPRQPSPNRLNMPNSLAGLTDPSKHFANFKSQFNTKPDANSSRSKHNFSGYASSSRHNRRRGDTEENLQYALDAQLSFTGARSISSYTSTYNHPALGHQSTLDSWLSSADNENNKFSSFAIKAEQVWLEAVESSDYALGNDKNPNDSDSDIHDWTPHRNKTAAACEILLNITEIFGRFKTFMKPVTTEVIRSIYDDAGDILENPRMSRIQLQSGVPFHELHKRLENEVTELREELSVQNNGEVLTEMLQKRTAKIFKVFHKSKLVLRDIIFNAWAKHIKSRKLQFIMFEKRKLGRLFDKWRLNVRVRKLTEEDPAFQFKKKWQTVEREKQWLVEERNSLLEELEVCLLQKGEQGHENAALYRLLEERAEAHKTHYHDDTSELDDLIATNPSAILAANAQGGAGYLKTIVKQKINHMKEHGLLHDIEEQVKEEYEVVKAAIRRRTVSEEIKESGYAGKSAKVATKILGENNAQVVALEEKLHHATELLQKAENEIIKLTKENTEKDQIISALTPKTNKRKVTNPAMELLKQVKKLEHDKECQTPEEWNFASHLTAKEKKEIEAKEREEKRRASKTTKTESLHTAKEQVRESASRERRRRSSASAEAFINELRARGIPTAQIKKLTDAVQVHPLKGTKMFAMSLGCEGILVATGCPDVQAPALSLHLSEEICLTAWAEKWKNDTMAQMGEKLLPLPETLLDSLVDTHGLRTLALKYFRSFLWSCEHYKDRSPRLKVMRNLLGLNVSTVPGNKSPKFLSRELESGSSKIMSTADFVSQNFSHSLIGSSRIGSLATIQTESPEEVKERMEADILRVYDAAKVQFFFNILKTFFMDPQDMKECLAGDDNFLVKKGACEAAVEENFIFLKTKNPEQYKQIFSKLNMLKSGPNKNDKRPHLVFFEVVDIFLSSFKLEREASKGGGSNGAKKRAKLTLQRLFKAARLGTVQFKMKQMGRLQVAFEQWDKKKNGDKLGGMYSFSEFKELLKLGVGAHDISEARALRLFHQWHDQAEQEMGWEHYLQEHNDNPSALEDFAKLSHHVQSRAWDMDDRADEEKRNSVLLSDSALGGTSEKKKDYVKMVRAGARMRSKFFEMNFTSMDHDLAQNVEVSRGVRATSIAFSKVLYRNNIYPSEAKIFRLGDAENSEKEDSDYDDEW